MSLASAIFVCVLLAIGSAVGLSFVIRSRTQRLAITSVFSALSLIGLLKIGVDGDAAKSLFLGGAFCVIGCATAIGVFRFWTTGTPMARAGVSADGLAVLSLVILGFGYLGITK